MIRHPDLEQLPERPAGVPSWGTLGWLWELHNVISVPARRVPWRRAVGRRGLVWEAWKALPKMGQRARDSRDYGPPNPGALIFDRLMRMMMDRYKLPVERAYNAEHPIFAYFKKGTNR